MQIEAPGGLPPIEVPGWVKPPQTPSEALGLAIYLGNPGNSSTLQFKERMEAVLDFYGFKVVHKGE